MSREATFLFVQGAAAFGSLLCLHAIRRRTSLLFSFGMLAFMTWASWAMPNGAAIPIGPFSFSVGSAVYYTAALLGVFVLYVADGPRVGRMGLVTVVGTALLYLLFAWISRAQFPSGIEGRVPFPIASFRSGGASILATLVDLVLLGVCWELCQRAQSLALSFKVLFTLWVVFVADVLIYVPVAWWGTPIFEPMLRGNFLARSVLACVCAPIVTAYLQREIQRYGLRLGAYPVLSILLREDLERELLSARHTLRLGTEALWESEERYRRMMEDLPLMVLRCSADGLVTYANAAVASATGVSLDRLIGSPISEALKSAAGQDGTQNSGSDLLSRVQTLSPQAPVLEFVTNLGATANNPRTQRWLARAVFSAKGEGLAYQCLGEDVTRQRETERALKRLAMAVANLGTGVAIANTRGEIEFANPALEALIPSETGALVGSNVEQCLGARLSHDDRARIADSLGRTNSFSGVVHLAEIRATSADPGIAAPELRPLRVNIAPINDAKTGLSGYVAIVADVSEELALSERLNQATTMAAIGQLAAGVAHDFNNLVTVIWSCSENVSQDLANTPVDTADAHAALSDMRQAADRAVTLTRQLLTLGKQDVPVPSALDLPKVLQALLPLLRRAVPPGVQVRLSAKPVPPVSMDVSQLERVVVNLVVNARDAMPDGGLIEITTQEHRASEVVALIDPLSRMTESLVELSVSDSGEGIDPGTLRRIFEPFFSTKRSGTGTGLGLATVYGIIEGAGGSLRVDSAVGKGTTFRIFLPTATDADTAPQVSRRVRVREGRGETILYCESDERVARAITNALDDAGYRVLLAQNAEQALAIAKTEPVRVLLCDWVAPADPGPLLAARLREQKPDLIAAYLCSRTRSRASLTHARDRFVTKPVERRALLETLADALQDAG
ncbi:MAG TPA: ATP-binding protein [Polyangiaceae bacterium]|jgi:signal transduction histidine kinase|nr:ATP-binding protein [Polyangiaceae bacterium]